MMNKKLWYATWRFSSRVPDAIISLTLASSWSYTSYMPGQSVAPLEKGSVAHQEGIRHF
jgi:hypothetical protein